MNLGSIIQRVRARKVLIAVSGLEDANGGTEYSFGHLAGRVQAYEEIAQFLDQLNQEDKLEDDR